MASVSSSSSITTAGLFSPLNHQTTQQHPHPSLLWPRRRRIEQQHIVCSSTLTSSSLPSRPRPRRMAERNSVSSAASVEEVQAARIERLWHLFLSDPSQWWDKRLDKENPKAPDFKHKTSKKALWINDRFRPPWLQEKLATLTLDCPKQPSSSLATSEISGQALTINRLWEEFFSDPSQWWDNRIDKKNPKFPDFKHKTTTKALWIDHRFSPSWVHARLAAMGRSQEQEESIFSTPKISGRVVKIEQLWQEFFLNPSQWWDNRLLKKSPKYPDFKHKSTNEGLWIESWLNPPWVKPKIVTMEESRSKFDGGSGSQVAYFGGDVSKLCQEGQLKEALQIVERMVQQSIRAPIKVYACLLQGCIRMKALAEGKRVHALIVQSRFESDIFLGNTLVDMYAKCGSLLDARQVFNKMPKHNVFSWTAIISAYANQGQGEEAINLFQQMQMTGIAPDKVTFVFVLKACASIAALGQGKQLHTHIIKSGLESDVFVASALVDMYAKCGSIEHARQVFNNMQERNVVSWTTMIAGCAQQGLCKEALTLFRQMQHEGMKPDKVTFASVLKACASLAALEQGKQVHAQIIKLGFELDTFVGSALVNMYAKCGCIEAACQVFKRISKHDLVSWNIMIAGYAQQGLGKKGLTLYEQMKQEGVQPDNVTFVSVLKACTSLEQCKHIHAEIGRSGVQLNVFVGNTLVDMYSKLESIDDARQVFNKMHERNVITWNAMITGYAQEGLIEDARQLFDKMHERDVASWNAMIAGYAQQGRGKDAFTLFEQMQREGMKPDEVTYICVLSACSHSGLVDEGRCYFNSMSQDHCITPMVDHYACMVDLLGRAGCLVDAEDFINKMPIKPDAVVWMALLGASRKHGNVELGRRAFDSVLKLEPDNAAAYVLLSNMYAAAGRWAEVARIRKEMEDAGVKKTPERSWIVVDNKVHDFAKGDTSHPQMTAIRAELRRLTGLMKEAGYVPDFSFVLHEQIEDVLCEHSERLAIAFGLISTCPGTPIRIKKNFTVCGDCHNATKIISKIVRREIIARDANGFHHFKDGLCSCGDY